MKVPAVHIILVHGLWATSAYWSRVISALVARGYPASSLRALDLSLDSLAADAARLRTEIARTPAPVLLVGHSYGGAVISEAKANGVCGVAYVAALALDAGESPAALFAQYPPPGNGDLADAVEVDSAGYAWVKAERFADAVCADLAPAEMLPLIVGQHVPRATVLAENVTRAAWRTTPAWYLISNQDHTISPAAQEMMAARARAKTTRLDACHASLLSRPKEVARFIDEAARGCVRGFVE